MSIVEELDNLTYDPSDIASLHLRAAVNLRSLTRKEFLSRLQILRELEPVIDRAFKESEEARWRNQTDDAPHGDPWHVSFHGSQFPGDQKLACPRQSLYRMMDFAPPTGFSRRSRTLMNIGKQMEVDLVTAFHDAGILLSAPPDAEQQTMYEDQEHWLTATTDAIILPWRWNKPLPIEIKSKDRETVEKMRVGAVGPDDAHVRQCKVEVATTRIMQRQLWPGLDLADHGVIYYMSRGDKKGETTVLSAEFRVDYDEKFWREGLARLAEWKQKFLAGELPSDPQFNGKKHPLGWRWSYAPCNWCDFKKICQEDHKNGVTELLQSCGVERTQNVRRHYDPQAAIQRVKDRWKL